MVVFVSEPYMAFCAYNATRVTTPASHLWDITLSINKNEALHTRPTDTRLSVGRSAPAQVNLVRIGYANCGNFDYVEKQ